MLISEEKLHLVMKMLTTDKSRRLQDIMKGIKLWFMYVLSDILNKLSVMLPSYILYLTKTRI